MKKLNKKVKVLVEKTKTGFSAYAEDISVFTTARNIPSLHKNLVEALNLHFEDEGYDVNSSNIRLLLDFQQFFQYYRVINAKFLAERIGMNPTLLSQYVQGKKNPSVKQSTKILHGIQMIGKELSEISFT